MVPFRSRDGAADGRCAGVRPPETNGRDSWPPTLGKSREESGALLSVWLKGASLLERDQHFDNARSGIQLGHGLADHRAQHAGAVRAFHNIT